MKKKNKKNHVRSRLSTILLCILAILLCAAPRGWADGRYYDGEIYYDLDDGEICDVTEDLVWLEVGADTTVNLDASVSQYVLAGPGSILNIHSGSVGYIAISPPSPDESNAVVTVYGTDFAVSNGTIQPDGNWTLDPNVGSSTLTGYYGGGDGSSINLWIFSDTPINLQPPPSNGPEEIQIDIKPGGNPNNINLKSKGVVSVAVLTTNGFDASTVDPDTVTFAGASPVRSTLEDVDEDGDLDMLFHFKTQDLVDLDENSTEAMLTCKVKGEAEVETTNEEVIQGTDTVRILPQKKK